MTDLLDEEHKSDIDRMMSDCVRFVTDEVGRRELILTNFRQQCESERETYLKLVQSKEVSWDSCGGVGGGGVCECRCAERWSRKQVIMVGARAGGG